MSKFTCLVLCVVAASLSNDRVAEATPTLRDSLKPILDACSEELGVTKAKVDKAVEMGDQSILQHPCFSGCVFKKVGFVDEQGQYDLDTGLSNLRKAVKDDEQYNKLAEIARQCTSARDNVVSDGTAGCERGALVSACFLNEKTNVLL